MKLLKLITVFGFENRIHEAKNIFDKKINISSRVQRNLNESLHVNFLTLTSSIQYICLYPHLQQLPVVFCKVLSASCWASEWPDA